MLAGPASTKEHRELAGLLKTAGASHRDRGDQCGSRSCWKNHTCKIRRWWRCSSPSSDVAEPCWNAINCGFPYVRLDSQEVRVDLYVDPSLVAGGWRMMYSEQPEEPPPAEEVALGVKGPRISHAYDIVHTNICMYYLQFFAYGGFFNWVLLNYPSIISHTL